LILTGFSGIFSLIIVPDIFASNRLEKQVPFSINNARSLPQNHFIESMSTQNSQIMMNELIEIMLFRHYPAQPE